MNTIIEGPPRPRTEERLEGGKIKGVMLRGHISWIREQYGEPGVRQILDSLSDESRTHAESPLASVWYPFSALIELDRAIIQQWGEGKPEFVRVLGSYSAKSGLSTTYKLFKRSTLHEFFERSTLLHSQFQDFGTMEFKDLGERKVQMVHGNYVCFSPIFCESALGYYEQVVSLHGDKAIAVREVTCRPAGDKACTYEIEWT